MWIRISLMNAAYNLGTLDTIINSKVCVAAAEEQACPEVEHSAS